MLNFIRRIWLPRTLGLLAPWFANFDLKFEQFAPVLGLASSVALVGKMNEMVQWLNAAQEAFDANVEGFRQFRDETLFAGKGEPAPAPPVTILPEAPETFQTSIIEWLVDFVEKKIVTADNYTDEIGVQLGIVVPKGDGISPGSVKPKATYFPANSGYAGAVVVTDRGDAAMAEMEIRLVGTEIWKSIKSFTGKSANFTIESNTPGQPVQIQARIQLYKNNEKYGQPSDAVYVTLNP